MKMKIEEVVKIINQENEKKLIFDEEAHTYTNQIANYQYNNASSFLSAFQDAAYKDFDIDEATKAIIMKKAAVIGLFIHKVLEEYIKEGRKDIDHHNQKLLKVGQTTLINFEKWISDNNIKIIASEQMLTSDENRIAGTIDLIFKRNNKVYLADFKTSRVHSNNIKKLSAIYALQLSIYKKLMTLYNVEIDGLIIIFINKYTGQINTKTINQELALDANQIIEAIFNKSNNLTTISQQFINDYIN